MQLTILHRHSKTSLATYASVVLHACKRNNTVSSLKLTNGECCSKNACFLSIIFIYHDMYTFRSTRIYVCATTRKDVGTYNFMTVDIT